MDYDQLQDQALDEYVSETQEYRDEVEMYGDDSEVPDGDRVEE